MKKILLILITVTALSSCDKRLDRLLVNPNSPTPATANSDLYLTQAQLSFAGFFNAVSDFGLDLTRMLNMFGPRYDNSYQPQSYDGLWSAAYTGVLKHLNEMIPVADAEKKFVHVGMGKIMKSYVLTTLVDMFGDVPMTEANQGVGNLNPKVDPGATVYAAAIALLDEALVDLAKTPSSSPGTQDLMFGGSAARWITVARSLKLRALMNTRLADAGVKAKIDALLAGGNFVDADSKDWEFKYSKKGANPNSRHPRYNGNHTSTGAGDYIATFFMWALAREKGTGDAENDPRTRYYLYRQNTNYANVSENTINCFGQAYPGHYTTNMANPYTGIANDMPFCLIGSGYWGRDHGDNSGIPPDGLFRTTVGVYPFGGRYDANQGQRVQVDFGGQGAGIQPLWMSSFTEFALAEYELMLNNSPANALAKLESGVRKSITKVMGFPAAIGYSETIPTTFLPTTATIDNYVNKVKNAFNAAATTDEKLNILMKEYWLAVWGNGLEAYNLYRRTNKPANLQFVLDPAPGSFINSHLYPSVFINRNLNATQKSGVGIQVFWDKLSPVSRNK